MSVVLGFELGGGHVVEFGIEPLVVEPADPTDGGEFEVVEALPVAAIGGEHRGVPVELGLEQPIGRLGRVPLR